MNNAIQTMLELRNPDNPSSREHAIKEILQEIALSGLSRGGFFEKAAFYGGTCLRIFHGLDRFSEDLDFALLEHDPSFHLDDYFPYLKKEFLAYGIDIDIDFKSDGKDRTIQSAFLKGNTLMLMLSFFPKSSETKQIVSNQRMKIKFEIDVDHPAGGITERRFRMLPSPYEVQVFDAPTLFAGKIHALICREYPHHVKGRDYYDYLFYIAKGTPVNLTYLENKLNHTGVKIACDETLTIECVKSMLRNRFETVDYEDARDDVSRFIDDVGKLRLWKKELFLATLDDLKG